MNNNKNITVKQAIDRYIESKYAVLSPSTVKGYMIVKRNQLQNLCCLPRKTQKVGNHGISRNKVE